MKKLSFIKRSNGSHWVGDGFPVRNIFSYRDIHEQMSPFLLLDFAGPARFEPAAQQRGVGQHPHRGFETVTIVYEGEVSHRDSSGGGGTIGPGDVQWMTAAGGIIHEEFHSPAFTQRGGLLEMVQLWVNLPAKDKMTKPSYQSITSAQIPAVALPGGGTVRVIAGEYEGARGPARTFSPMNVWDVRLKANEAVRFDLPEGRTAALLVLHGAIRVGAHTVREAEMAVMERAGSELAFEAEEETILLLLNGQPLNEPIIGHGPFVMNTEAEIHQAVEDFNAGRMGQIATEVAH